MAEISQDKVDPLKNVVAKPKHTKFILKYQYIIIKHNSNFVKISLLKLWCFQNKVYYTCTGLWNAENTYSFWEDRGTFSNYVTVLWEVFVFQTKRPHLYNSVVIIIVERSLVCGPSSRRFNHSCPCYRHYEAVKGEREITTAFLMHPPPPPFT